MTESASITQSQMAHFVSFMSDVPMDGRHRRDMKASNARAGHRIDGECPATEVSDKSLFLAPSGKSLFWGRKKYYLFTVVLQ